MSERVVVIGAGPAGLTAAYELNRLEHPSVVLEADPSYVGGLSRTVSHAGYRFDIGGHRFFTSNGEIKALWHELLPREDFLEVDRLSRIYYGRKLFDYPLRGGNALRNLGPIEAALSFWSYCWANVKRKKELISFEDWVVAHFGRRLYRIFFETYTEKVWGMPGSEISADWAAQRIRSFSLARAIYFAITGAARRDVVIKTLAERFEYPRLGPGMMWERTASQLQQNGVDVVMGAPVVRLHHGGGRVREVIALKDGSEQAFEASDVVSSMPLRELVLGLDPAPPPEVVTSADALRFRDFISVALVVDVPELFPDNWIYIHEPDVKVGRVQNFKNWSPDMVPDPTKSCLGMEYFCFSGDNLWNSSDEDLIALATDEIGRTGLVDPAKVVDGAVVRAPKAYPIYDFGYERHIATIRSYLAEAAPNVEVCGRNGMHRYNNQDHAMLTGLIAARNIAGVRLDQWRVNEDAEYLEEEPRVGVRDVPKRIT